MSQPQYTQEQVAVHNTKSDCWVIFNDIVLDVTSFIAMHPGGASTFDGLYGQDITEAFHLAGHTGYAEGLTNDYAVGTIVKST